MAVTEVRATDKKNKIEEPPPNDALSDPEKKEVKAAADQVKPTDVQGVALNVTGQNGDGYQPTGATGVTGVGAANGARDAPNYRGSTLNNVPADQRGSTTYEQFRQPDGSPVPKANGKGTYPTEATLIGPEANGANNLNNRGLNVHALLEDSAKGYPGAKTPDAVVNGKTVDFAAPQYVNGETDPVTGKPTRTLEQQMAAKSGQGAQEIYLSDEKLKSPISQREFATRLDEGVRSGAVPKNLEGAYFQNGDTLKHFNAPVAPEAASKIAKGARILGPVGLAVGAVTDTIRFAQSDDKVKTGASIAGGWAGAAVGAKGGAAIGATIGTFIAPGVGTVIGGVVGGAVGAFAGYMAGSKLGEKAVDAVREYGGQVKDAVVDTAKKVGSFLNPFD
jgi:hypothetical protein